MTSRRLVAPAALLVASALVFVGCASTESAADDGRIAVVASTDVYGQIVEEIGGDLVDVTAIVSSPSQDPHSFEPTARDQLAVSRAELVVENGGGYDAFVDALIEASGSTARVLTAVEYSHDWPENDGHVGESPVNDGHASESPESEPDHEGHDHGDHGHVEGFNEHVWYDPHSVAHLAEAIAEQLAEIAPDEAATFTANLDGFAQGIMRIEDSLAAIDTAHGGTPVFATEPVPLYLTAAAGLVGVAPEAFTEAVEEGQDVPPATLLEALNQIGSGEVRLVVVNAQTGGAETARVIDAAESAGIPVVEFTETLPDDETYLSWMRANVDALAQALAP